MKPARNLILRSSIASIGLTSLAFAQAPGTCAEFPLPGQGTHDDIALSAAFDGTNFLVTMQGGTPSHFAGARRIAPNGQLVGPLITATFSAHFPLIGSGGGQSLLIANDDTNALDMNVSAQFVSSSGALGPVIPISRAAGPENVTGVASDGTSFLVVYAREINSMTMDSVLRGRIVSAAGAVSAEIPISSGLGDHALNNVAFDGSKYLVVWTDDGNDAVVMGRFVSPTGVLGAEFTINASPALSDDSVSLAFDGTNYLVLWSDEVGPNANAWDIFGQLVSPAGALVGGVITITTAPNQQALPCVAFDGSRYLVTWTDMRNDADGDMLCDASEGTCWDVFGQYVSTSGTLASPEFPITLAAGDQLASPVAAGAGRLFVAWTDGAYNPGGDVWAKLLEPSGCPLIVPYCSGDSSRLPCPCGNSGTAGHGCANSVFAGGALLTASGSPSVSSDTLVLSGTSMPNSTAVYFQGTAQTSVVLDDGIGCVTGSIIRLGTKTNSAHASSYPSGGNLSISVKGAIFAAGATRYYQCFYRNSAAAFCPPFTSNRTNGVGVSWIP